MGYRIEAYQDNHPVEPIEEKTKSGLVLNKVETAKLFVNTFETIYDTESGTLYEWNGSCYTPVLMENLIQCVETCFEKDVGQIAINRLIKQIIYRSPKARWKEQGNIIWLRDAGYDLDKNAIIPLDKDIHRRYSVNVKSGDIGKADCPTFIQFMDSIFPDNEDNEQYRDLFKKSIAISLLPKRWLHNKYLIMLIGGKNTGKSTYMKIAQDIFYENGNTALESTVSVLFGNDFGAYKIPGKRVIALHENEQIKQEQEPMIKSITECGGININMKYGKMFELSNYHTNIYMSYNTIKKLPKDAGLKESIILLPFINRPKYLDPMLLDKLKSEAWEIFKYLLPTIQELYKKNGFITNRQTATEIEDMIDDLNELPKEMIDSIFEFDNTKATYTLEEAYEIYQEEISHVSLLGNLTRNEFLKELKKKGVTNKPVWFNGKTTRKLSKLRLKGEPLHD